MTTERCPDSESQSPPRPPVSIPRDAWDNLVKNARACHEHVTPIALNASWDAIGLGALSGLVCCYDALYAKVGAKP